MDLGKSIKILRQKKGFNQELFSEKVGINQSYLSLLENNKKEPSVDVLKKISEVVEIPLAVLFWFTVEEKDVPESKKEIYNYLKPSIDNLLKELFK